jgi:hypothetical protein
MDYREFEEFCADGEAALYADLFPAVSTFECRFCGAEFDFDTDMSRHADCYGCGCIPEDILDLAAEFGLTMLDIRTWEVDKPKEVKTDRQDYRGEPIWATTWEVCLNGKSRRVPHYRLQKCEGARA